MPPKRRIVEVVIPSKPWLVRAANKERDLQAQRRTSLPNLSDDVLLMIMHFGISLFDIIALRRMNRRLHGFTRLRSVWRYILNICRLDWDFPVHFPLDPHLSAEYLERIAVTSFRLQQNLLSPNPTPIATARVKTRKVSYTSLYAVGNEWLLTLEVPCFVRLPVEEVPRDYTIVLWRIKGSLGLEEVARHQFKLAGCASILGAHVLPVEKSLVVAVKVSSYQVSILTCRLPDATVPAEFMWHDTTPYFRPLFHTTADVEPDAPERFHLAFDMDGYIYAQITAHDELAIVNWKTGVYATEERTNDCEPVSMKIIGNQVLLVTDCGYERWELPNAIAQNPPVGLVYSGNVAFSDAARPIQLETVLSACFERTMAAQIRYVVRPCRLAGIPHATIVVTAITGNGAQQSVIHYDLFVIYSALRPSAEGDIAKGQLVDAYGFEEIESQKTTSRLRTQGLLRALPFSGPPPCSWHSGSGGFRSLWFCSRGGSEQLEERLIILLPTRGIAKRSPNNMPCYPQLDWGPLMPENTQYRALFNAEFAAQQNSGDLQRLLVSNCCAYDDVRGRVFLSTAGGNLYILSYARPWPDEDKP